MHFLKLACFGACHAILACQDPTNAHVVSPPSLEGLVDYRGQMTRLFDDEFGGIVLGDESALEQNTLNSKRSLSAEKVLACTVGTVTEGSVGTDVAAILELRTPGLSLIGGGSELCPAIEVRSSSVSYSILKQSGASLVGKSVVIFVRDFNDSGVVTRHWHIEPDRPDIRSLVQQLRGR